MQQVMELHDDAKKNILNTKSRFFLSRESNEWLNRLDGTLLSTI